jgi:GTPase SAR1 family protein
MPAADRSGGSLVEEVRALALEWDRPDVAAALDLARELPATPVVNVVAVGATGVGKSRLLNALVGGRVCPVDVEASSNCYVSLEHGPTPRARVVISEMPEAVEVPLADVAAWASEQGNPGNRRRIDRIEVTLPAPTLAAGVRLVDTPGIGGLDAGHRRTSLAAIAGADALLFVLDPASPLSRTERDFLIEAAERIRTVAFVMTKADLYLDSIQIAAESQRLLAQHAPRFAAAPWFTVSAADKEYADATGDPELLAASGFPTLERELRERIAGNAMRLRIANLVCTVAVAIDQLEEPERTTLAAIDPDQRARLAREAKDALDRHAERARTWTGLTFAEHQRRVSNPVTLEFRRQVRALAERHERSASSGEPDLATLAVDLDAELRVLTLDLRRRIVAATEELLAHLTGLLGLQRSDAYVGALNDSADVPELPALLGHPDPTGDHARSPRILGAASVARSALYGRSLTMAMGPLGLLIGLAVGGMGLVGAEVNHGRQRQQNEVRQLVNRALETARIEIDADMRARLLDAQQFVQQEIRVLVEQRNAALAEQVARCTQAEREGDAARAASQSLARERLTRTVALRRLVAELGQQAESLLPGPPAPLSDKPRQTTTDPTRGAPTNV